MSDGSWDERRARLSPAKQALLRQRLKGSSSAAPGRAGPRTRPPNEPPRLAPEQGGLWTLHRLAPEDPTYHLVSAFRVGGDLDQERLRDALRQVVARHRILRSGWRPDGDGAVQVIAESVDVSPRVENADAFSRDRIRAFAREPFDLTAPPLLRLLWVRGGKEPGWLVAVLPHLITDEHGLHTFWCDLEAAYHGRAWPAAAIQFDDVVWARREAPDRSEADLAYWRDLLAEPFETPDVAAPPVRSDAPAGRLVMEPLDPKLARTVADFARSRDLTSFSVYLAATFALWRAVSGRSRIAVGCPVSTRERPEEQRVIGYFLNAVVTTMQSDPETPFADAAAEVHQRFLQALEHRRLPFDRLVETLQPPRPGSAPPWFQTMLVAIDELPGFRLGDARLWPEVFDIGVAKFDLTLFVSASGESPWIGAEFRTARHDESEVRALLKRFVRLLGQAVDDPARPMRTLDALLPVESVRLFSRWQPDGFNDAGIRWVRDQILQRCRDQPDTVALRGEAAAWTYGRLASFAHRVQAALTERGVGAGDRVALHLQRSPEMAAAILGVHCAGAAYVPLDPVWPEVRTQQVLDDAEAAAVIADAPSPGAISIHDLPPESGGPRVLEGSQDAYLIYTSGSTGAPKGVRVSHANLRAATEARVQWYPDAPEVFLLLSGFAFDSSVAGLFWTLAAGGTLVIPSADTARDPAALRALVAETGVTHLLGLPSLIRELTRNETDKLSRLRTVIVAGEPCSTELVTAFRTALPRAVLTNEYGPTETTVWATAWTDDRRPVERVPIGRPAPHARVYVLDDHLQPVLPGQVGAAWIGGAGVSAGYWRRDDQTAERFRPDPFAGEPGARMYHSGDRMRWRSDGQLEFFGRADNQLKIAGWRIEPGEIEQALREIHGIRDACVVLPPGDAALAGALTAFLVLDREPPVDAALRRRLRDRLPEPAIPARMIPVDSLPRLPNGKIDRIALARSAAHPSAGKPDSAAAGDRDPVLQTVLAQWQKRMDRPGLNPRDNIFEHGAHSLQIIQCAEWLSAHFGFRVPVPVVFQHPAPHDLANWIRLHRTIDQPATYQHLFPVHIEGDGAPLFAIQPDFTSGILTEALRGRRPVYGLRGIGLRPEGNAGRWPTLSALADEMIDEIRAVQSEGPYRLSGYSLGAVIAIEAAHRMEARGLEVARLIVFDPTPWNMVRIGPFRLQLRQCRRPVTEIPAVRAWLLWLADNRPWAPFLWRRFGRVFLATPYRRLVLALASQRSALSPRMMQADSDTERFRLFFSHHPSPIAAPTLFFNAQGPDYDAATLWRPYLTGPLDVRDIDTVHQQVGATPATRATVIEALQAIL